MRNSSVWIKQNPHEHKGKDRISLTAALMVVKSTRQLGQNEIFFQKYCVPRDPIYDCTQMAGTSAKTLVENTPAPTFLQDRRQGYHQSALRGVFEKAESTFPLTVCG